MKKSIPLAAIVASTVDRFLVEADKAPTEEHKASLLRCAQAAERLGLKLAVLQEKFNNEALVSAISAEPEHQLLVMERNFRFTLSIGEVKNG